MQFNIVVNNCNRITFIAKLFGFSLFLSALERFFIGQLSTYVTQLYVYVKLKSVIY
jgi:hypothetical protein